MASIWTMDIPTIVFSRIVSDFSEDLKTKYKMQKLTVNGITTWKNFSTSQVSETPPIFPYITVIELPGQEAGEDLERTSVNGATFTFQIDVFDNQSESRTKGCMKEAMRIMKTMMFLARPMPSFDSKPQEHRMTARFTREIDQYDVI